MSRTPEPMKRIAIVDFQSGRGMGGHYDDYLAALQQALADHDPLTIAPAVETGSWPGGRLAVYRIEIAGYRRALKDCDVAIVHSAELSDYVSLWIAAASLPRSRRGRCLFVLRRSPDPTSMNVGNERIGGLLVRLIARMIKRGVITPVSDSQPALNAWLACVPGSHGEIVALPPAPDAQDEEPASLDLPDGELPLVAIAGRMRAEKGAANYPAVVEAALKAGAAIALQTSEDDGASAAALNAIRRGHGDDPRVALLGEHLTPGQYQAFLKAADVVVLPYDIASYGAGTSGVVSDALALGARVVVSPIEWARATYSDDPRVAFVEDPASQEQLAAAIAEAISGADGAIDAPDQAALFAASWRAAIDAA